MSELSMASFAAMNADETSGFQNPRPVAVFSVAHWAMCQTTQIFFQFLRTFKIVIHVLFVTLCAWLAKMHRRRARRGG